MIKWFESIGNEDFNQVGGKGFNLSLLYNSGFNVPNGFIILSQAYDAYISNNHLNNKITAILNSNKSTTAMSEAIKALFDINLLDPNLVAELKEEFNKLSGTRAAVRSSSTVEDLPGLSFAGQYSSYLNVTAKDLVEKVIMCWQSLKISEKKVQCQYAEFGIETIGVDTNQQLESSLNDVQLKQIAKEAVRIEKYFNKPQDIEFGIDQYNNMLILQSRDITSLFPIDNLLRDDKLRAYLCINTVALGMKEPFTPLGYDIFSQMIPTIINVMTMPKKPMDNSFMKYAGGRMFADITYLLSSSFVAKQFGNAFSGNDLPLKDIMNNVIAANGKKFRNQGIRFKIPWGVMKYGMAMLGDFRKVNKLTSEEKYTTLKQLGVQLFKKLQEESVKLVTIEEKLSFVNYALVEAFKLSQKQALYCGDFNYLEKAIKQSKEVLGETYDVSPLNQAYPGCITVELGLTLNKIAQFFDENNLKPSPEHPKIQQLLEKFGHRANIELDLGTKRWSEDPGYLINLIATYMNNKMYLRNQAEHSSNKAQAEELIEVIYQKTKDKHGINRAKKLKALLIKSRAAAGMREYPKYDIVKIISLARKVLLELGSDFNSQGLINNAEDIFFVHVSDITSDKNLKEIASINKEAYYKELQRTSIPRIILNTGETYYSAFKSDPSSKILQGMPLSPGIYEGIIRVVFDPLTTDLREGEIMVTESTNPAWTPLFITAKGLIMEYGGPLSHGGVVAREYGIPAVVGIPSATAFLKDGQRVRINGETGTVELLSN